MTSTRDRTGLRLSGIALGIGAGMAFGIAAGFFVYVLLREHVPSFDLAHAQTIADLVPGGLLILSGTWQLFLRAVFPNRFTDSPPDRMLHGVTIAACVLLGFSLLLPFSFKLPLGGIAIVAMLLARLRFPKRIFAAEHTP